MTFHLVVFHVAAMHFCSLLRGGYGGGLGSSLTAPLFSALGGGDVGDLGIKVSEDFFFHGKVACLHGASGMYLFRVFIAIIFCNGIRLLCLDVIFFD